MISAAHVSAVPTRAIASGEQRRVADPLGLLERRPGVASAAPDVGLAQMDAAARSARIRAERASSSAASAERLVAELDDRRRCRALSVEASANEDVGSLDAGRNLGEELLEHRSRPLAVAGEAVEVRRPQAPLSRHGGIVRRQLGGELAELGRSGGRAAGGGLLGGRVELGGDRGVGTVGGEREVTGALLDVRRRRRRAPGGRRGASSGGACS